MICNKIVALKIQFRFIKRKAVFGREILKETGSEFYSTHRKNKTDTLRQKSS